MRCYAIEQQALEIARLTERLEDLEDLQELQKAMAANAGLPLHPWEAAREELGLTDQELARAAAENSQRGNLAS